MSASRSRSSRASRSPRDGASVIADALIAAGTRPLEDDKQPQKNKYAVAFAERMAQLIAEDFSPLLHGIEATTKRSAGSVTGKKQLDINFSTPQIGLALGISLKSVHIREKGGRYTHNLKRNEEELRIEAAGYHKRQPYAVMVGVLFLPFDSVNDGRRGNPSSFGSWVRHLRPYTGRTGPTDEVDKLELIYIGLYQPDGGDLRFFDVRADPPKNQCPPTDGDPDGDDGRPRRLLNYPEFLDKIYHTYLLRNSAEFRWADGSEEPLNPAELDGTNGDDS